MDLRPDSKILPRTGNRPAAGESAQAKGDIFRNIEPSVHAGDEEQRLLRLAGTMLVRARDFERRISEIETASQACKCARDVAGTIMEILEQAKLLLTRMRETPDPEGRRVMARSFNEMLRHVDQVVAEGHFGSDNLAQSADIKIMLDASRREGFEIAGIDMGCAGLDLLPLETERVSNADIIERLSRMETAGNLLHAHGFSYESIARLLQSRMKFARGMVDILEEGNSQINNSRTGHEAIARAVAEICRTVAEDAPANGDERAEPAGRRY